jgi:glycosyltransferase involved in cell wall biosynthesis
MTSARQAPPRRVLHVEHNVDGTVGGSHRCLLDICKTIRREFFQPVVLFFQDNALVPDFRDAGAEVLVGSPAYALLRRSGGSNRLWARLLSRVKVAANAVLMLLVRPLQWSLFLRRHRIDIVHLNNTFNADHDLILAAWVMGIPCIAHQRGVASPTGASELWFGRRLARIIAISAFIRDDLIRRGVAPEEVVLIRDGIDPARVRVTLDPQSLRSRLGIATTSRVIGIVGNLKRWKGQHVFLEAMIRILPEYPEVLGLVVGSPVEAPYVAELQDILRRHSLEKRVLFVGYQQHSIDFMALMDVVVHASVEPEPFGIVITEAMALGKPVIATAHGGPVEIVADGISGFLTPAGDAEVLAERIRQLLDQPEVARKFGEAGRMRFEQEFVINSGVRRLESLYGELCGSPLELPDPPEVQD